MAHRYQRDVPARSIAFFISPHGFGHAARAAGVMEALTEMDSSLRFDIFTAVPQWFFANGHRFAFRYHRLLTDIGLVQKTPFQEDLPATVQKLETFLPFNPTQIAAVAEKIRKLKSAAVICDIAPMGIRVAGEAGIPSVLVENFTWDWLYGGYKSEGLKKFAAYLQSIFTEATYHIQTRPVCQPAETDLTVGTVSRKIKTPSKTIRQRLGLPDPCRVVMITAGGIRKSYSFIDKLKKRTDIHFIIPGASNSAAIQGNLILMPENSAYFHPDLINASDAVIGKVGYSTLAEIYQAGVPFGYCARNHYRESGPLVDFIKNQMSGIAIGEAEFQNGTFVAHLDKLLEVPRAQRNLSNGADQIAHFLFNLLFEI
jgi:UDP-N-acetylglucosamine:LPS N-acetylglucosamine transferase